MEESPTIYSFFVEPSFFEKISQKIVSFFEFLRKLKHLKKYEFLSEFVDMDFEQKQTNKIVIPVKLIKDGAEPFAVETNAIIDTGAECCSISPQLANMLQLPLEKTSNVFGATGSKNVNVYKGDIAISDSAIFYNIELYEAEILGTEKRPHLIIGMDILSKTAFSYDFDENGNRVFSFREI
ncbi:MAG: retroviral-like aspartic protease [Bacteroidales bacterium]|nr:retroviral-like aspartic protease [Candidatus Scybalousia scybalohippi]